MTQQHRTILGLILSGSTLFAACSSDGTASVRNFGDAGSAGESNGASGAAGAPDGFVFPDALNPQGVIVPEAGPTTFRTVLVAGSDYLTTEIASVTLGSGKVQPGEIYADGDTVALSSAGIGFALERTNDQVH